MGRRDDYKGTPIHDSIHLKKWDTHGERQDRSVDVQSDVQRAVQDVELAERHAGFDESAKDNHAKYERAHFAVVGECSKSADENYRRNYGGIDWSK